MQLQFNWMVMPKDEHNELIRLGNSKLEQEFKGLAFGLS